MKQRHPAALAGALPVATRATGLATSPGRTRFLALTTDVASVTIDLRPEPAGPMAREAPAR